MMRKLKKLLHRWLSWFPVYQVVMGGWRYYQLEGERMHRPEDLLYWGKHAKIGRGVVIHAPERLYLGDGTVLSGDSVINAVGGCRIGKYCGIGPGVQIITTDHKYTGAESLPFGGTRLIKPVCIDDYVWIGSRVSILPGVRIGEGAIIGLGSIVCDDVPPLAVVRGNPATVVGYRRSREYETLKAAGAHRALDNQCNLLWIPPFIRSKYPEELKLFGFDSERGESYYIYDKHAPPEVRLIPVEKAELSRPTSKPEPATEA